MTLIKTDRRSSLSNKQLNNNMAIKMLSESVEKFDPMPAITYWNTSGVRPRRPHFKDCKTAKSTSEIKIYNLDYESELSDDSCSDENPETDD